MMNSLVEMYRKGAITADHLLVECLQMIDPADPAQVLGSLPEEVLVPMLEFARRYRPDVMVTNYGVLPGTDQVEAARRWIEDSRRAATIRSTTEP